MNSSTATLALLLLNGLALAPLAVAAARKRMPAWLMSAYAAVLLAVAGYQLGFNQGMPPLPPNAANLSRGSLSASQCADILTLLDQNAVIVDRRHPPRLVVTESLWQQVPEDVREVVISCIQESWPQGSGTPQVTPR